MSDANPQDQSSDVKFRPPENDRIVIALPYAITNMVFIQSLPFWILAILGVIGFVGGFASGKPIDQTIAIWIGSAVCGIPGIVGLLVLKRTLWRWALEGRAAAITVLYVFYAVGIVIGPFFFVAIAAFVFLPNVFASWMGIKWLLVPLVLGGILWLFALMNLFESEIWSFARLDGCCPRCRKWRFGRIRRPQIVQCAECGAELEFDRAA
jgi:MFS family permease